MTKARLPIGFEYPGTRMLVPIDINSMPHNVVPSETSQIGTKRGPKARAPHRGLSMPSVLYGVHRGFPMICVHTRACRADVFGMLGVYYQYFTTDVYSRALFSVLTLWRLLSLLGDLGTMWPRQCQSVFRYLNVRSPGEYIQQFPGIVDVGFCFFVLSAQPYVCRTPLLE